MVDSVLNLYYSKIMVSEDIKHEVKKLHVGKKIRDLRKKAGLVLQDLSNETGLSKPLLSQIEKQVVSPPIATLLVEFKRKELNNYPISAMRERNSSIFWKEDWSSGQRIDITSSIQEIPSILNLLFPMPIGLWGEGIQRL